MTLSLRGGCALTADVASVAYSGHTFVSATATIETGQTCQVTLQGATSSVDVDSGNLVLMPTTIQLVYAGSTTGGYSGYVTGRFDGSLS